MFEPLKKRKRKVEHSDKVPVASNKDQLISNEKLSMMNSSNNIKHKFEVS